jgi:hypothetical protein
VLQHNMERAHLPSSMNMAWNTCTPMYQTPCHYIAVMYLTDFILYEERVWVIAFFIITVIYSWIRTHLIIINVDIKIYKVENRKVINIKSGKYERTETDWENNSYRHFYFNKANTNLSWYG